MTTDLFICGICLSQFTSLEVFLDHKRSHCSQKRKENFTDKLDASQDAKIESDSKISALLSQSLGKKDERSVVISNLNNACFSSNFRRSQVNQNQLFFCDNKGSVYRLLSQDTVPPTERKEDNAVFSDSSYKFVSHELSDLSETLLTDTGHLSGGKQITCIDECVSQDVDCTPPISESNLCERITQVSNEQNMQRPNTNLEKNNNNSNEQLFALDNCKKTSKIVKPRTAVIPLKSRSLLSSESSFQEKACRRNLCSGIKHVKNTLSFALTESDTVASLATSNNNSDSVESQLGNMRVSCIFENDRFATFNSTFQPTDEQNSAVRDNDEAFESAHFVNSKTIKLHSDEADIVTLLANQLLLQQETEQVNSFPEQKMSINLSSVVPTLPPVLTNTSCTASRTVVSEHETAETLNCVEVLQSECSNSEAGGTKHADTAPLDADNMDKVTAEHRRFYIQDFSSVNCDSSTISGHNDCIITIDSSNKKCLQTSVQYGNLHSSAGEKCKELFVSWGLKKFCQYEGCEFSTVYSRDLLRHRVKHTGDRPFKCTACAKTFNRKDKLLQHTRTHGTDRPHACDQCNYRTLSAGALRKHIRCHTNERPYKCELCSYAAKCSSQLVVHMRRHTGDAPFTCLVPGCAAAFRTNSDLKRHQQRHDRASRHLKNGNVPRNQSSLVISEDVPSNNTTGYCKRMVRRKAVRMEMLERTHHCPQCLCSFVSMDSLRAHARVHLRHEAKLSV